MVLGKVLRYDIENNAKIDKYRLEEGDVILSIRGQALKSAIIPQGEEDLLLSQNFIGIRCGSRLYPEFLKVYLDSPVGQFLLAGKLSGTTVPTLNRKDIEAFQIPDLSSEEQYKMITEFSLKSRKIERKIELLQAELSEAKTEVYKQMGIGEAFEISD